MTMSNHKIKNKCTCTLLIYMIGTAIYRDIYNWKLHVITITWFWAETHNTCYEFLFWVMECDFCVIIGIPNVSITCIRILNCLYRNRGCSPLRTPHSTRFQGVCVRPYAGSSCRWNVSLLEANEVAEMCDTTWWMGELCDSDNKIMIETRLDLIRYVASNPHNGKLSVGQCIIGWCVYIHEYTQSVHIL